MDLILQEHAPANY